MAEDGGRDDHFGVITALENFEVCSASQSRLDCNAHFARFERDRSDLLNANIFFAIKDCGSHPLVYGYKMGRAEVNFLARPQSPAIGGAAQSGRGQPHSRTLSRRIMHQYLRKVLECGCPLPLSTEIPQIVTHLI